MIEFEEAHLRGARSRRGVRRHSRYIVHAGLHARMEFEFLEPIRAGARVRSRGSVVDKYERRGKPYMVW